MEEETSQHMRIIFMPKRKTLLRLTVSFVLIVLAIVSLAVFLLYTSTKDEIAMQLLRRVRDAAVVSARLAERSSVKWDKPNFQKSQPFKDLFSLYWHIRKAMDLENIYIIDRQMRCLLKVEGPPVETAEEYVRLVSDQFDRAFQGEVMLSELYREGNKKYVSVYAPIYDGAGKVEFLLGVDTDVSKIGIFSRIKWNSVVILGVTIVASLLISAILSYTIVTPIKKMVVAADAIGLGNFDTIVPVNSHDEIGFLGQTMNDMIQDIKLRDQKISELTNAIIDDLRVYNELILEGMINGVLTFDLDGRIESVNPAAGRILGMARQAIIGQSLWDLGMLKGRLLDKVRLAIDKRKSFSNFEAKISRQGREALVTCDFAPLFDREGKQIGHMLFLADVTEIRRLETQVKLKEKLAAIGELSAGIAHEIRNPLNSIELFLGLLQRKLSGRQDGIELVGKVRNEIQKLNQILSDFLKFARPMPLDRMRADIRTAVTDAVFFSRAAIDQKQIDIRIDLPDEPMDADIDRQQIQQAFTNIVLNATQAMELRGLLRITGGEGRNGSWELAFADNGPGIPGENLGRIFDPFFTTKAEGTGLGLAMVHKIIDTHGGQIEVKSDEKGTTFIIHLPRTETLSDFNAKELKA